jgi:TIR domain
LSNLTPLETFIEKVCQRPLPNNPIARVRTFAKELAEGAVEDVWDTFVSTFRGGINQRQVMEYIAKRWDDNCPRISLLVGNGYVTLETNGFVLNRVAFDLLEEAPPATIFISYKRSESSAFALLVLARLKAEGLQPFLDVSLVPGEDWQAGLKERIQKYDYFISLLGKETLNSEVVIHEIRWALEAGLTLIPIWHNGFKYESGAWKLPAPLDIALRGTHTIRVIEESALGYNNAIVELLNRFGITP